jgi:hypothetical protein
LAALVEMLKESNEFVVGVASILGQQSYTKEMSAWLPDV